MAKQLILKNIHQCYDGTSASAKSVHEHVDLTVDLDAGTILSLEPHRKDNAQVSMDALIVDASQWTVTPGLIDAHVHVATAGNLDLSLINSSEAMLYTERNLYALLTQSGVTSARDTAGATFKMKSLVDQGVMIGPRLKIAINLLSPTGGHADFRSKHRAMHCCHGDLTQLWPAGPGRPSNIVDGPDACRQRVRETIACGADWIKLCTSGGVASPGTALEDRAFTQAEVDAICDEAHARGRPVAVHAHSYGGIEIALNAGVDTLEHITMLDQALAKRAYKQNTSLTPTAWIIHALKATSSDDPVKLAKIEHVLQHHEQAIAYAQKQGCDILVGSDCFMQSMFSEAYLELAYLMQAGIPIHQVWFGATGLAADKLGFDNTGRLIPGARADILIADGDIINQPSLIGQGHLKEVIQDGVGYKGCIEGIRQRRFEDTLHKTLDD